jgi:hypothetical protein
VSDFLNNNLQGHLDRYAKRISRELMNADPLPGSSCTDEIKCYNEQFLREMSNYIHDHVLVSAPNYYSVNDGLPISGNHAAKAPDQLLQEWTRNARSNLTYREDPSADLYQHAGAGAVVTFYDQSAVNLNQHIGMYENTSAKYALNRDYQAHTSTPFGVSNYAADSRLLSRVGSIFRRNEDGIPNGIPNYEARLYRRNTDRDIREGLKGGGESLGCMQRGYDMTDINARISMQQQTRSLYTAPSPPNTYNNWVM